MADMPATADRARVRMAVLLLLVVVAGIYAPTVGFDFVNFDDPVNVTASRVRVGFVAPYAGATVTDLMAQAGRQVWWAFTSIQAGYWAPVTWLSHMLDCEVFGLWAGGHHLVNVALHVANTGLVFLVFERLTGRAWASLFVAAAFGLHPLRVESVAWITERKDVLSTAFWLLTMLAYLRWVAAPRTGRWVAVVAAFVAGLMSKPMLVSLPLVLLGLDWWPLGRLRDRATAWTCVREKASLFALAAASSAVIAVAQFVGGAMVGVERIPIRARVVNAAVSYLTYLRLTVWPSGLAVFYPWQDRPLWQGAAATAVLLVVSAAVAWSARRRPYLAVGWGWFLITLLPVIGLLQVGMQSYADRFMYVPLLGLALMGAGAAGEVAATWPGARPVLAGAGVLLAAGWSVASAVQVSYWRNSETLFTRALAVTSENYLAHNNLGEALMQQGRGEEAMAHYSEAMRINPRHAEARVNVGNALTRAGRHAEAIPYYREVLRLRPGFPVALNGLGVALAGTGDLPAAILLWQDARAHNPEYIEPFVNLGGAFMRRGEWDEAAGNFIWAHLLAPQDVSVVVSLAAVRARQGKLEEAVRWYLEALRMDPTAADAHAGLGITFATMGRFRDAGKSYGEALRYRPEWSEVAGTLAWLRATSPTDDVRDGTEAIRLAEGLRDRVGTDSPEVLDILAAAYAEGGRWPDAVATAEQARARAAAIGKASLVEKLDDRLRAYRAGQPTRDPALAERASG